MGNKLFSNNFHIYQDHNKYDQIDKGSQNQWLNPTLQQNQQSHWTNVTDENLYYRTEYGKFTLYRNQLTLQQVEKYKIVLKDRNHFNKFCNLTKWRNNCQYLPKVQHFIIENNTQICVSQFQVNLFTQRIPLRLADLTDIPFPQNLYFMTAMLKGYKYIFGSNFSVKMFKPTQSMVGVNRQGEVKVWWNQNLSALDPVESNQVFISEQDFVKQLIDMVEQNTDNRQYPYPLKRYLSERKIPINGDINFIINQIYNYAKQMKVIIPKYAFSVREILTRDMFENTKLFSQNSLKSNEFKIGNNHMQGSGNNHAQRQVDGKNKYQSQHLMKRETFGSSNQNIFNPSHSENILSNNNHRIEEIKNNQGVISHLTKDSHSVFNNRINVNFYGNESHQDKNKINSGYHQIGTNTFSHIDQNKFPHIDKNRLAHIDKNNFSINSNYSFNKLGRNIVQFNNKPNGSNQIMTYPQQQIQSDIFTNKLIVNSNPIRFNNTPVEKNNSQIIVPQQQYSAISFHHNQQNSLSLTPSQYTHPVHTISSSLNSQITPYPRNRHNSYHIPSTYQNQIIPQFSHLNHQNSTPIFPQPLKPKQLSTKVSIQRINRAPSSISQNSHINQFSPTQKQSSQQKNNKTPSIDYNITNNHNQPILNKLQQIKLRYFTKKDSQQTLDPQIVADLAKYLNHT